TMIRNLNLALEAAKGNDQFDKPDQLLNGKTLRQSMVDALALLRAHGDHPEHRIGNEVILTSAELKANLGIAPKESSDKQVSTGSDTKSTSTPTSSTTSTTTTSSSVQMSNTSGELHTPGVSIHTNGVMLGTPVAFTAEMGPRMSQKIKTCFIVSVMRGLVSKNLGREHLSSRVSQQGGDYYVKLTHNGADHVVKVPAASLAAYKDTSGRPDPIHALECALVNFMQLNKIDNYHYERAGDSAIVAGLLGLGEILVPDIKFDDDDVFSTSLQNLGGEANQIITLTSPDAHKVGTMSGKHVVFVSGTIEGGNVAIMDSLSPSSSRSVPLGALRQAFLDGSESHSTARWQMSVFTIPASQQ
ncbi:hypothetical protein LJC09_01070, partial [Desulfovibrio sp. OttesenSCG-928-F20]|nr:hypothetical protein [Desulfovibrio sp. OttesenSCG-928-F20]